MKLGLVLEFLLDESQPGQSPHEGAHRMLDLEPATRYHRKVGVNTNDDGALMETVRHVAPPSPRGWLLFGRYTPLAPGAYEVRFRVRVQALPESAVARVASVTLPK